MQPFDLRIGISAFVLISLCLLACFLAGINLFLHQGNSCVRARLHADCALTSFMNSKFDPAAWTPRFVCWVLV